MTGGWRLGRHIGGSSYKNFKKERRKIGPGWDIFEGSGERGAIEILRGSRVA